MKPSEVWRTLAFCSHFAHFLPVSFFDSQLTSLAAGGMERTRHVASLQQVASRLQVRCLAFPQTPLDRILPGPTLIKPPASSLQPPASSLQPPASSLQPPASSWRAAPSDRRYIQVKLGQPLLLRVVSGWNVGFADHAVAVQALQVHVKAPQTMQVAEHFFG